MATKKKKKTAKKKAVVQPSSTNAGRRKPFDLKPSKQVKEFREGTKRATLIKLLKKGASFEACMKATGWNHATCYEGIKLLNTKVGFGITESNKGVIRLVTK